MSEPTEEREEPVDPAIFDRPDVQAKIARALKATDQERDRRHSDDEELIAELRQEMLGYRSPQWAHLRRLVLAAADALTRSQSRVEELEQALRNLLDTIERGDGYRAFERTAAARDALTNSEQGRTP